MKNTFASFAFSLLLISFVSFIYSCKKDHATTTTNDMYTISATMSPSQETGVLNGSPTGSGTVSGTYNAANNSLQYSVTWTGLTGTATGGHFHGPALAGTNAAVVVPFTLVNNGTSGTASGTVTLTDGEEADLLAGKWYANIHTAANGGGEIRGQVSAVHQ